MSTICVIPARGGSKRIPRKNVRLFRGKPIIAWSIEAAKATGRFDHIVVSTDDNEIAEVGKNYGASVPFLRPAELADDFTGTTAVVVHAITELLDQGLCDLTILRLAIYSGFNGNLLDPSSLRLPMRLQCKEPSLLTNKAAHRCYILHCTIHVVRICLLVTMMLVSFIGPAAANGLPIHSSQTVVYH
jgi:hypothetical protein